MGSFITSKENLTRNSSLQSNYSYCDRNPFYKTYIITLRTVVQIFADITMLNIYPIWIAFIISALLAHVFQETYDHSFIRKFDWPEALSCSIMIYVWNILSTMLSHHGFLHKLQFILSRVLCTILLFHSAIFEYRWFFTPGTCTRAAFMNLYVIIIFLWNYIGFGIVALYCRINQQIMNYFVLYFISQIGFYIWTRFTENGIRILLVFISIWVEILAEYFPGLYQMKNDYKRGLFYSNFLKEHRKLRFTNLSEYVNDISIRKTTNFSNYSSFISIKDSTLSLKSVDHLPRRSSENLRIAMNEEIIGIHPDEEYGSDALHILSIRCKRQIEEGVHINVLTLFFYQCILILTAKQNSVICVLTIMHLIGFSIFLNETTLLIHDSKIPLQLIIYILTEFLSRIIPLMSQPSFKHIIFAPYFDFEIMDIFL